MTAQERHEECYHSMFVGMCKECFHAGSVNCPCAYGIGGWDNDEEENDKENEENTMEQEIISIVDGTDVTISECSVMISASGQVYYRARYFDNGCNEDENLDPIWVIYDLESWQETFNNLDQDDLDKLKSFADDFIQIADASNIDTYISYFGCDAFSYPVDYTWEDFKKLLNGQVHIDWVE